jgi:hypothetical protein
MLVGTRRDLKSIRVGKYHRPANKIYLENIFKRDARQSKPAEGLIRLNGKLPHKLFRSTTPLYDQN